MSVIGHNVLLGASGNQGGYTVGNSLRFRSSASAYLNRTPASATNQQKFTVSAWVKRGSLSSYQKILGAGVDSNNRTDMGFNNTDNLTFVYAVGGTGYQVNSTAVYRDPSAWYHVVFAVDTTQATASNRVLEYVNGVQITSFSSSSYPPQNNNVYIDSTNVHRIANAAYSGASEYFDGYIAEMYLIDGQQLTPTSFGAYDGNGVWQPKKYTGTYGTNGFYLPFSSTATTGFSSYYGSFNGSNQYLSISTAAPIAFGTNSYTVEAWVYPTSFSKDTIIVGGTSTAVGQFGITTGGNLYIDLANTGTIGTSTSSLVLNRWQHIAYVRNGSTVTFYINGSNAGGSFTGSQSYAGATTNIGTTNNNTVNRVFTGYISNVRVNNGNAVYTANFTPPTSALTAIAGTSLLTLQNATIIDNSTNAYSITNTGSVAMTSATVGNYPTIANDSSGNGNNWTPNNISLTAGYTYDSMLDSPTNAAGTSTGIGNYCIVMPNAGAGGSITNGNLTISGLAGQTDQRRASLAVSSGKWYYEINLPTLGSAGIMWGIIETSAPYSAALYGSVFAYQAFTYSGITYIQKHNNSTASTNLTSATAGDVLQLALDLDNNKIWFGKNNTWADSGNPATGANTAFTVTAGNYVPAFRPSDGSTSYSMETNFGQRPYTYTPPTGFKAFNTFNLPAPTITNGAQYMAATLYTGNGSTQSIVNSASSGGNNPLGNTFYPDFVWIKNRSAVASNILVDSVRGATNILLSNSTQAQASQPNYVTALNSNGFSVGNGSGATIADINANTNTYVGWQWNAGSGSSSSNTSGSITSTVSANQTAGFSIVTWTGNGTNGTIGHGLGAAPSMILAKIRSTTDNWIVYHSAIGATNYLGLNTTNASTANSGPWNNTSPTSSVFSVSSTSVWLNNTGSTYVAYCFAAVRGYSAFGSYTGNGSTDGPFTYLGFRPRFIMIKRTDTTMNWYIFDTSRDTYNVEKARLFPNLSDAELTNADFADYLSNGFKLRSSDISWNASGGTYIYAAFAENPFNYSRAR